MDLTEIKERIELRQGDIAEIEADAVVNAANTDLILGAGVSGAIGRKGGDVIQEECDAIGSVPLGEVVVTSAGAINAQYVIHAASLEIGHFARDRDIERATRSALQEAEKRQVRIIAFPAIGTGVAAFPADKCAQIMLAVVAKHLAGGSGIERVLFVLFDADTLEAFQQAFEQLGTKDEGHRPRRGSRRRPKAGEGNDPSAESRDSGD